MRSWLLRRYLGVPVPLLVFLAIAPLFLAVDALFDDDSLIGLLCVLVLVPLWPIGAVIAIVTSLVAPTTSLVQSIAYAAAMAALSLVFLSPMILTFIVGTFELKFAAFKPSYDAQIATCRRTSHTSSCGLAFTGMARTSGRYRSAGLSL